MFGRFRFRKENPEVFEIFVRVQKEAQNMFLSSLGFGPTPKTENMYPGHVALKRPEKTETSVVNYCNFENRESRGICDICKGAERGPRTFAVLSSI